MVYDIKNYWVFDIRPLPDILENRLALSNEPNRAGVSSLARESKQIHFLKHRIFYEECCILGCGAM
jgi:hypothetical protein